MLANLFPNSYFLAFTLIPLFILMFISSIKESYYCCGIITFLIGRQEKEAVGSIFIFIFCQATVTFIVLRFS